jgi:acyl dehydratase
MNVGDAVPELNRRIDLQTLVRYAGASGDFNPIHYDEQYARAAGLPGVIGHGMLAMALVSEAVTDWVGDSGLVRQISVRFTGSYRLGDVLTVSGEVVARRDGLADLRLRCVNQEGTEIVGRASATVWAEERSSDDD